MLPSPDNLRRFAGELSAQAAVLADVRSQVLRAATCDGGPASSWSGPANLAFITEVRVLAGSLHGLSVACADSAALTRAAAEQVARELAALRTVEHRVLGALEAAVRFVAHGASAETAGLVHRLTGSLPPSGSPHWRQVESQLTRAGLL